MKSGNIVLIGPTNSGKSSLVNKIMGQRVSLVSRKNSQLHLIKRSIRNSLKTNLLSKILQAFFRVEKKLIIISFHLPLRKLRLQI